MTIKYLAEDDRFKIYSIEDNVYLKQKKNGAEVDEFQPNDLFISWNYGNPTSALILQDYIIISGCGITIFNITQRKHVQLFAEPSAIQWTEALHQSDTDSSFEFRYVSEVETDKLQIFKMNALTKEVCGMS